MKWRIDGVVCMLFLVVLGKVCCHEAVLIKEGFVVSRSGEDWKWLERKEAVGSFSGGCRRYTDARGHKGYTCQACFDSANTVFQVGRFVEELNVDVDLTKLEGLVKASVPLPEICVDPCKQSRKSNGEDDRRHIFETERQANCLSVCTPERVDLDVSLENLLGGFGVVTRSLKETALKESRWVDPLFPGAAEIFGGVCLTLTIPLCTYDMRMELTYAGVTLHATSVNVLQTSFSGSPDAIGKASCKHRHDPLASSDIDVDAHTKSFQVCSAVSMPLLTGLQVCLHVSDLVITGTGLQGCVAVQIDDRTQVGCLHVGHVEECNPKNCSSCMLDPSCGWCPSIGLCMPHTPSLSLPCAVCPDGTLQTEHAEFVCEGNPEQYTNCVKTFRELDNDKRDFLISRIEFRFGPGKFMYKEDAIRVFESLDKNGNGALELSELCAYTPFIEV
ncbi:hypothetical protein QOT17_014595 [Balamuthia mandrillaris]